jgi:hypothetical protein
LAETFETVYTRPWHSKDIGGDAETIDDLIRQVEAEAATLRLMRDRGVVLSETSNAEEDSFVLATIDQDVADEFGFDAESEGEEGEEEKTSVSPTPADKDEADGDQDEAE